MHSAAQPPVATTALIYVVVIALFVWRMMRPARVSVARIWSRPIILVLITAVVIWAEQVASPSAPSLVAAVTLAGVLAGVPLGIVRGRHSDVRATDRPGVYYVHSSPLVVIVWLVALLARAAIRYAMPQASHVAVIWSFGLLGFAASAIAVSAYLVHQKLIAVQQGSAAQVSKAGGT
ncbi:MAG TPA: hypothetical protein VFA29_04580 [Candidatus Baltobacteraceae bacterium]|nr:hypothetical protein [Candidatus Baltobacteraceae bacterium]